MSRRIEIKIAIMFLVITLCLIANFLLSRSYLYNVQKDLRLTSLIIFIVSLIVTGGSFYLLRKNIFSKIPHIKSAIETMKNRDLSTHIQYKGNEGLPELCRATEELFFSYKNLYKDLLELSSSINIAMSHIWHFLNTNIETLDNHKQRGEQISFASEDVSRVTVDIAKNADSATRLSVKVTEDADNGMKGMKMAINSINALSDSTESLGNMVQKLDDKIDEVGGIINIINDIADQTNLLALNAAIEAARAGDQGRGFAVVADEVRKLAEKTMSSTSEISEKIKNIQSESRNTASQMQISKSNVEDSVKHINNTRNALGTIVDLAKKSNEEITKIATAINQQSATSEEISHGIEDFTRTVMTTGDEMKNMTQEFVLLSKAINNLTDYIATFKMPEDVGYVMEFFKSAHKNWVQKLYRMYYSGESIDPSKIADHKECRLGKWYFGPGSAHYRGIAEFSKIESPHKEIHHLAKEAATAYKNGDISKALNLIKQVDAVSREVVNCLENFKRAASKGVDASNKAVEAIETRSEKAAATENVAI